MTLLRLHFPSLNFTNSLRSYPCYIFAVPNPPQNVVLHQTSPTAVTITWEHPVDGYYDNYYLIYQGEGLGPNEATLAKTSSGFILNGLTQGINYQFGLFSQVNPDTLSDVADITFIPLSKFNIATT